MIQVIAGTNRPEARSLEIAKIVVRLLEDNHAQAEVMDLKDLPLNKMNGQQYSDMQPKELTNLINKINTSEGLVVVCPEYNGSIPGVLKYFIDHWSYPTSFEYRPIAFIGLGGIFGGLRPVEHLQQVFGYRNAYTFPERVFLINIWNILKDGEITDETALTLLKRQAKNFVRFIAGLKSQQLDAHSILNN